MSTRSDLLESIAETIADYREIPQPTVQHIAKWIEQFDDDVREPMLEELDYVLERTYVSRDAFNDFIKRLVNSKKLAGSDPCSFWKGVSFLDRQSAGNSQREMLEFFDPLLRENCGFGVEECGGDTDTFIYLDDASFTGNRILDDLRSWIQSDAPSKCKVHVVTMAFHRGGRYYAGSRLKGITEEAGKEIGIKWWCELKIEDRKPFTNSSDVLRPTAIPDDKMVHTYVQAMEHQPVLRHPGSVGGNGFFSSEAGRHLLEQELLKAGARIRSLCPYLNVYQRPLGNMVLETLGFGSMLVTFRNCPNNAPLALWAGDPWYPLFPRKTN